MATHLLRTLQDKAHLTNSSIGFLFIDLSKAFDMILREIVLGWPQIPPEDHNKYIEALGFTKEHAEELVKEINSGTVLEDVKVHPHVIELLSPFTPGRGSRSVRRTDLLG